MTDANNNISYSLADIQRYLQGDMNAKEMHDLELAALEDPFLADALEGYNEADMQHAQQHLAQIETAISQQKEASKVIALPPLKKYRNWQVAASVILLISIAGITYSIFNKKSSEVTLVRAESSSSATSKPDSVQMRVQTFSPPTPDTSAVAKKEMVGEEKNTSLFADNKRKNEKELPQPTAEAPVPMTAMKEDSNKAGLSASSAMAMRAHNNEIAGTIIDNHQQPVPNAKIVLQDSTQARTDRNGNFSIPTNDSSAVASITTFGYKPVDNQKLRKGRNTITDAEVTNSLTKGKRIADTADIKPQGGWQSFQEYVYNKLNKKYDSTSLSNNAYYNGYLELEFSISEAGDPYNFKILNAPDTQTANKAITAIKEGPRWISNDKSIKMRVTVRYK